MLVAGLTTTRIFDTMGEAEATCLKLQTLARLVIAQNEESLTKSAGELLASNLVRNLENTQHKKHEEINNKM